METMALVIMIIFGLMIIFSLVAFLVGLVQKSQRKNDALTKKTKLLEMYAAEEKARAEAEAAKEKNEELSKE